MMESGSTYQALQAVAAGPLGYSAVCGRAAKSFPCLGKLGNGFRRIDETAILFESAQIQRGRSLTAAFQAVPPRYVPRVDDRLDGDDG